MHMYYFQFANKRPQLENANLYIVNKPFSLYIYITINPHLRDFYIIFAAKHCLMSVNQMDNWNHVKG